MSSLKSADPYGDPLVVVLGGAVLNYHGGVLNYNGGVFNHHHGSNPTGWWGTWAWGGGLVCYWGDHCGSFVTSPW